VLARHRLRRIIVHSRHSFTSSLALGAAIALATSLACSSAAIQNLGLTSASPDEQARTVTASIRSDADIMGVLHQSNLGEINAGTLAAQRASDAEVRTFASMMVTDHTSLDRQGTAAAQGWGVAPTMPDNPLPGIQQTEMSTLNRVSNGTNFDRTYMASQVIDHQRTLRIVDAAIGSAQRPELRTMLQNQVRPPVAAHLARAQAIQGRIGMP
jgi:putative membrane protein